LQVMRNDPIVRPASGDIPIVIGMAERRLS
jgi:hypothetical protein